MAHVANLHQSIAMVTVCALCVGLWFWFIYCGFALKHKHNWKVLVLVCFIKFFLTQKQGSKCEFSTVGCELNWLWFLVVNFTVTVFAILMPCIEWTLCLHTRFLLKPWTDSCILYIYNLVTVRSWPYHTIDVIWQILQEFASCTHEYLKNSSLNFVQIS